MGGGSFANGPSFGYKNSYSIVIWESTLDAQAGDETITLFNLGRQAS